MNPTLTQAASLPNIPWQNRPGNCSAPVWRYTENPIISRNPIPDVARIFNSAVIPYPFGSGTGTAGFPIRVPMWVCSAESR